MKHINLFLILSLGMVIPVLSADELKPFSSDGCSSFPDGTFEQKKLWLACCEAHDEAYWLGGSYEQRVAADQALKKCVVKTGEKTIAKIMLAGVRVGGSPYWPTEFRWGYGWSKARGYQEPTEDEKKVAEQLMEKYRQQQLNLRLKETSKAKLPEKTVQKKEKKLP